MTATPDRRGRICGAYYLPGGVAMACPRGCTAQERDEPPMARHTPYLPGYRLQRIREQQRAELAEMEQEQVEPPTAKAGGIPILSLPTDVGIDYSDKGWPMHPATVHLKQTVACAESPHTGGTIEGLQCFTERSSLSNARH